MPAMIVVAAMRTSSKTRDGHVRPHDRDRFLLPVRGHVLKRLSVVLFRDFHLAEFHW